MTPSSGTTTFPPFKFRPRRESVDWRRINAVDIDLVVSQLDVDVLQEHISMVTFCSLDGERCQRCQSPVDPALVKLLQLAQLTVEWLLHCQEYLTVNFHAAEERLAADSRERKELLDQQSKQEEKMKSLITELKQRKKVIRTQQSMFAPQIINSQKCLHCDKAFVNHSYLQNHLQRRHPEEYKSQLRSDNENKSVTDSLKLEISNLKEQIVQQQQILQTKTAQEKELQSMHKELLRELDHFKAEEMARMDRKIENCKDGIRKEMEFLYTRNIQALTETIQNQTAKHEDSVSSVPLQPERDLDIFKEMQTQAFQKLEHQLTQQDKNWDSRLQEIKAQHDAERNQLLNELSRMQSEHQERNHRLQEEMERRLQEKDQTIQTQMEQIKKLTSNPLTQVVEVPVIVSTPTPEPKPKIVVIEEPVAVLNLDPVQELSEVAKGSSSSSERRPVERNPQPIPEKKQKVTTTALKLNPSIKKEMRPELELAVIKKLDNLGIKPGQNRLTNKELTSGLSKVRSKQNSIAKQIPDYWHHRKKIESIMEEKITCRLRRSNSSSRSPSSYRQQVLQIRPRSSSLPSRASQVMSSPTVRRLKTPQSALWTRRPTLSGTPTPNTMTAPWIFTAKTPPFSSDGDSEEENFDMEVSQPQRHQSQIISVQTLPGDPRQYQVRQNQSGSGYACCRAVRLLRCTTPGGV